VTSACCCVPAATILSLPTAPGPTGNIKELRRLRTTDPELGPCVWLDSTMTPRAGHMTADLRSTGSHEMTSVRHSANVLGFMVPHCS
jgi:hypothetical protein